MHIPINLTDEEYRKYRNWAYQSGYSDVRNFISDYLNHSVRHGTLPKLWNPTDIVSDRTPSMVASRARDPYAARHGISWAS